MSRPSQGSHLSQGAGSPPTPFLPSPPLSHPLAHTASATRASWLFLQHTRYGPAPGPSHVLFPHTESCFSDTYTSGSLTSFRSSIRPSLIRSFNSAALTSHPFP